jgi:putative transposase
MRGLVNVERLKMEEPDHESIVARKDMESDLDEVNEILCSLSEGERERVTLLQELLATAGQSGYRYRQQAVAQKLTITVRSVRRLIRQLREEGVASVMRRSRSDQGEARISEEWQKFIVKTYRDGNRGSCQLSPAQVAVRVKVRAMELGQERYPSHMTVYRVLKPLIEKAQQPKGQLAGADRASRSRVVKA